MKRALLSLLVLATPAEAYECTRTHGVSGPSLTWPDRTVRWVLNAEMTADIPSPDDAKAALIASFQAWTDVACSDLSFELSEVRAGARAEALDGGPYENVVVFLSASWPYDPNIIALTTNAFDPQTGRLFDSDIEINDERFEFVIADSSCVPVATRMDLQNTITHEVGHVVGLDHPRSEPRFAADTMYASAPPCETSKRSLEDGDSAGVCAIYPVGQPNSPCFGVDGPQFLVVGEDDGMGCSAAQTPGIVAWIAIGALALLRRRTRLSGS